MKLTPSKIVSFLRKSSRLTFTEASRRLGISYYRVNKAAIRAGIKAMDSHATRREAIASLVRLNPNVPYHRLGKAVGLSYPAMSAIATRMGIHRHVPRNAAATKERENGVLRSLGRGRTFMGAATDNGCSKNVVWRIAKKHGIRRPGCPPFSYTRGEEKRAVRWLLHPSVSYPRIAKKIGLKEYTVFFIAVRNGIRRRLPTFYREEVSY